MKNSGVEYGDIYPYMFKVSIGSIFLVYDFRYNPETVKFADAIIYLNAGGIILTLIYSIFLRRMLVNMNDDLDKDVISPSDFTIIGRNLPINLT